MKYMNNHFGQNRIFGKSRCKLPMELQFFAESDSDAGASDALGCGAGAQEVTTGEGAENKPTYDQLLEELAKARTSEAQANAERERFKNSVDDLTRKNKTLTEQVRERMTADEQAAAAKAEAETAKDARIQELESKFRVMDYSKRFMGIGMDEAAATELAGLTGEIADPDKFFSALDKFVKAAVKKAGEDSVQALIRSNPSIKAGNGAEDEDAIGKDMAVAAAKRNSGANLDILKHYGLTDRR